MIKEWRKFRGWMVLEYFLQNPNKSIHINGLARELKIGPQASQVYLSLYEKDELLSGTAVGNMAQYCLRNESPAVRALKKFYFLQKISESGLIDKLCSDSGVVSFIAYGSYADGTYSEKSDLDILMICNTEPDSCLIDKIGNLFKVEAQLTCLSIGEWRKMAKAKENFAESVRKNHVVLWGAEI